MHVKYDVEEESQFDLMGLFDDVSLNFEIYSKYLVNYEPAMQKRGHLLTTNRSIIQSLIEYYFLICVMIFHFIRKFGDFLEKALKDPQCCNLGLESLLILPVQRIPRYRLLLEQLIKFTPLDHPEYALVQEALDKICDVAQYNNEAIRARENRQKIMEIMLSFDSRSRIDLLNDDNKRRYIKDGSLLRQCRCIHNLFST